jgi:hypothetical protein
MEVSHYRIRQSLPCPSVITVSFASINSEDVLTAHVTRWMKLFFSH